ncbi:MAG: hypothetical protein ACREDS_06645 [Limisphaerales bacterium]
MTSSASNLLEDIQLQQMELSGLMKLPDKYHALVEENQPKIREIIVTESKPAAQSAAALN